MRASSGSRRFDEASGSTSKLGPNDQSKEEETVASLRARLLTLETALGMSNPWPVVDILHKLADAADHLLYVHGCDNHGWEEISITAKLARESADVIVSALAASRGREPEPEIRTATPPEESARLYMTGGKDRPLTDDEVDAMLAVASPIDKAQLDRIRGKFEELKKKADSIERGREPERT